MLVGLLLALLSMHRVFTTPVKVVPVVGFSLLGLLVLGVPLGPMAHKAVEVLQALLAVLLD